MQRKVAAHRMLNRPSTMVCIARIYLTQHTMIFIAAQEVIYDLRKTGRA